MRFRFHIAMLLSLGASMAAAAPADAIRASLAALNLPMQVQSISESPLDGIYQAIWCAKDQQEAMTEAKLGNSIAQATCTNPVAKQYELGMQMGVQGTPAIFLANGTLVPGYKPAKVLAEEALANQ